ncbi:MAG: hypothetical protein KDA93_04030 [Planctomycetaceae bacterium]|nr:hypothetical protein [Planctomycetaceae bacterium]
MSFERMKSTIAGLVLLAMFVAIFVFTSRDADSASVTEGKFLVTVDDVTSGGDYFVKRLEILANQASGVRVKHGDEGTSWVSLEGMTGKEGTVRAQVVIMCDMSQTMGTEKRSVTLVLNVGRGVGGTGGGLSRYTVPADTKLDELVTLNLPDGEFDVGSVLTMGEFQGKPITLQVER